MSRKVQTFNEFAVASVFATCIEDWHGVQMR
jgi:hypothetical protein